MKNLFYRLIMFIDSANEDDLNYKIAFYMITNFYKLGDMRISELAKACYVSAATISRFCRELGYDNYAELRHDCVEYTAWENNMGNLIQINPDVMRYQPKRATEIYVDQLAQCIKNLANVLDWNVIDQVLKLIHKSDDIHFFGIQASHDAAVHLQGDLMVTGKFTHANTDSHVLEESARKLTEDSVAIILSVKGNYMYKSGAKALKYMERSGCYVVVLTSLDEDQIPIPVDYLIPLGNVHRGQTGKHALLATVELMALRYFTLYYPSYEALQKNIKD